MSPLEQQSDGFDPDRDRQEIEGLREIKLNLIRFLTTVTPGTLPADDSARQQQRDDRRDPNRIGLHW